MTAHPDLILEAKREEQQQAVTCGSTNIMHKHCSQLKCDCTALKHDLEIVRQATCAGSHHPRLCWTCHQWCSWQWPGWCGPPRKWSHTTWHLSQTSSLSPWQAQPAARRKRGLIQMTRHLLQTSSLSPWQAQPAARRKRGFMQMKASRRIKLQ